MTANSYVGIILIQLSLLKLYLTQIKKFVALIFFLSDLHQL